MTVRVPVSCSNVAHSPRASTSARTIGSGFTSSSRSPVSTTFDGTLLSVWASRGVRSRARDAACPAEALRDALDRDGLAVWAITTSRWPSRASTFQTVTNACSGSSSSAPHSRHWLRGPNGDLKTAGCEPPFGTSEPERAHSQWLRKCARRPRWDPRGPRSAFGAAEQQVCGVPAQLAEIDIVRARGAGREAAQALSEAKRRRDERELLEDPDGVRAE